MDENRREEILKRHFSYYRMLEHDLFDIEEYVEIAEGNFCTYSLYFSKMLQSVCGEIDSLFKLICGSINDNKIQTGIKNYQKIIMGNYSSIVNQKVRIINNNIELTPWENWKTNDGLKWWKNYNEVKHNRLGELNSDVAYKKANLENVLYSLAALFILNRYAIYILFNENESKMEQLYLCYKSKKFLAIQFCECHTFFMGYNRFDIAKLKKIILADNNSIESKEVNVKEK